MVKRAFFSVNLAVLLLAYGAGVQAQIPIPIDQYSTIDGTVSSSSTGMLPVVSPLPGATVYLQQRSNIIIIDPPPVITRGIIGPILYVNVDSAITDKSGAYAFDSVTNGSYRLSFSKKGYQDALVYAAISKDTTINAMLAPLSTFYTVTGKVTTKCPDGMMCLWNPPIPGCTVSVIFPLLIMPYETLLTKQAAIAPIYRRIFTGISDAAGNYLIDSIPAPIAGGDSVTVIARKAGFTPDTVLKFAPRVNKIDTLNFSLLAITSGIRPATVSAGHKSSMLSYQDGSLVLRISRSQKVNVSVFRPDGRLMQDLMADKYLSAGSYSIMLDNRVKTGAVVLVKAIGEDFSQALLIAR